MITNYDTIGDAYVALQKDSLDWEADLPTQFLLKAITGMRGRILDAGCGNGKLMQQLQERNVEVTGIDISSRMRALAPQALQQKISVGSIEHTEFMDKTFSGIISRFALHYLPQLDQAYTELHRILKPGGLVALVVEHPLYDYALNQQYGSGIQTRLTLFNLQLHFPSHTLADYLSPRFLSLFSLECLEEGNEQGCSAKVPAYLAYVGRRRKQ